MCQVAFGRFTLKFSLKHECCYMQAQKRVEKLCFCSYSEKPVVSARDNYSTTRESFSTTRECIKRLRTESPPLGEASQPLGNASNHSGQNLNHSGKLLNHAGMHRDRISTTWESFSTTRECVKPRRTKSPPLGKASEPLQTAHACCKIFTCPSFWDSVPGKVVGARCFQGSLSLDSTQPHTGTSSKIVQFRFHLAFGVRNGSVQTVVWECC